MICKDCKKKVNIGKIKHSLVDCRALCYNCFMAENKQRNQKSEELLKKTKKCSLWALFRKKNIFLSADEVKFLEKKHNIKNE